MPQYTPKAGSWSTGGSEVANPMSIYPEFKPRRDLFAATPEANPWRSYGTGGTAETVLKLQLGLRLHARHLL